MTQTVQPREIVGKRWAAVKEWLNGPVRAASWTVPPVPGKAANFEWVLQCLADPDFPGSSDVWAHLGALRAEVLASRPIVMSEMGTATMPVADVRQIVEAWMGRDEGNGG